MVWLSHDVGFGDANALRRHNFLVELKVWSGLKRSWKGVLKVRSLATHAVDVINKNNDGVMSIKKVGVVCNHTTSSSYTACDYYETSHGNNNDSSHSIKASSIH